MRLVSIVLEEHSFFLRYRRRWNDYRYVTSALGFYEKSPICDALVKAVEDSFLQDGGLSFGWLDSKNCRDARKSLEDKLIQIVMDDRMRRLIY